MRRKIMSFQYWSLAAYGGVIMTSAENLGTTTLSVELSLPWLLLRTLEPSLLLSNLRLDPSHYLR